MEDSSLTTYPQRTKIGGPVGEIPGVGQRIVRAWRLILPGLSYLFSTETHAYSFSIAANALLSFFPFTLILMTVCRRWLHWEAAYQVIVQLLQANLPPGPAGIEVVHSLSALVRGRHKLQLISLVMFFFTSSGIFLPLEVALNKVWRFKRDRSFLGNQWISFLLAMVCGVLALATIALTAAAQSVWSHFLGWLNVPAVVAMISRVILEVFSFPLATSIYFTTYYVLPNGRVPMRRVLPAAVVAGILTMIAKFIYIVTLPMFRFGEVYGPFTLSVTLLFWAYVVALILLLGAHLSAQRLEDPNSVSGRKP